MWDIPLYPSYVNGLSTSTKHNPVICGIYPSYIIWLVVLTILKNMKVNRKDDNPYTKWKITVMFETTNQYIYILSWLYSHWNPQSLGWLSQPAMPYVAYQPQLGSYWVPTNPRRYPAAKFMSRKNSWRRRSALGRPGTIAMGQAIKNLICIYIYIVYM